MNHNNLQLEKSLAGIVNNQDSMVRNFFYQQFPKVGGSVGFVGLSGTMANYYSNANGDVFSHADGGSDAALAKLNSLIAEKKDLDIQIQQLTGARDEAGKQYDTWIKYVREGCGRKAKNPCNQDEINTRDNYGKTYNSLKVQVSNLSSIIAEKQKAIASAQSEYNKEANKTDAEKNQDILTNAQAEAITTSATSRASNLKILAIGAASFVVLGGLTFLILRHTGK